MINAKLKNDLDEVRNELETIIDYASIRSFIKNYQKILSMFDDILQKIEDDDAEYENPKE